MAKSTTTDDAASAVPSGGFEAKVLYAVTFSRPVTAADFPYLPRDNVTLRGAELNKVVEEEGADVIRTAVAR